MRENVKRSWNMAILGAIIIFAGILFQGPGQSVEAQVGRGVHKTFTAQTTTGATTGYLTLVGSAPSLSSYHTIELITTGGPSGCTYRLQGSSDNSTWYNISGSDITCTSTSITFESSAKPAVYVRGNLLTLTGGTSPTVTLKYTGK